MGFSLTSPILLPNGPRKVHHRHSRRPDHDASYVIDLQNRVMSRDSNFTQTGRNAKSPSRTPRQSRDPRNHVCNFPAMRMWLFEGTTKLRPPTWSGSSAAVEVSCDELHVLRDDGRPHREEKVDATAPLRPSLFT